MGAVSGGVILLGLVSSAQAQQPRSCEDNYAVLVAQAELLSHSRAQGEAAAAQAIAALRTQLAEAEKARAAARAESPKEKEK